MEDSREAGNLLPSGPPASRMTRLVALSDGTWNTLQMKDRGQPVQTNVAKMRDAVADLAPGGVEQKVFYDAGVGTEGTLWERLAGGAFGAGLGKNVQDVYRPLARHHREGDEIFLFGFSRGAYTVRRVAGMIRKTGLLLPEHEDRIPEAYALYEKRGTPDDPDAVAFRRRYARDVRIRFLGVWDTVGCYGIPGVLRSLTAKRQEFHDTGLSRIVDEACHAVAVDERRRAYVATMWDERSTKGRKVEQRWFVGAHSNVGGGYVDRRLSDEPLLWMLEKARAAGLALDEKWVGHHVRPDALGELRDPTRPFWWLMGTRDRVIQDEGDGHQVVDAQVRRRWEADAAYRPGTLEAWLRDNPWK